MTFTRFETFIAEQFGSQTEAAKSLHISVHRLNRILNGSNRLTFEIVGRVWYFWSHLLNLPGVVTVLSEIGEHANHNNGAEAAQ